MTEGSGGSWDGALSRRLRSLLKTRPFHRIREHQGRSRSLRPHDDIAALCLKTLELLVDALGLSTGASREEIARALLPLIEASDRAAGASEDAQRRRAVCDAVVGVLLNDEGRQQAYEDEYTDCDETGIVRKTLRFRIASEQERPDGTIVIRAEADGVNLFLRSLDVELEDAQAATEAALRAQLQRGRLDLAQQSAYEANVRSVQFRDKVRDVLRRTRRDVGRVDWRRDAPAVLNEAVAHLKSRLHTEKEIRDEAEGALSRVRGTDEVRALRRICAVLEDCTQRHLELHQPLIRAYETFLEEQLRQRFAPLPLTPLPPPEKEVLVPTLARPMADALTVLDAFSVAAVPATPPPLLDLANLWEVLLRPKRAPLGAEPVADGPLAEETEPAPRFEPAVHACVEAALSALSEPTPLSSLLERMPGDREEHLLVLRCLHGFAPDQRVVLVSIERAERALRHARFAGDELLIVPEGARGD